MFNLTRIQLILASYLLLFLPLRAQTPAPAFEAVTAARDVTFVAATGTDEGSIASYTLTKTVPSLKANSAKILTVKLGGSGTTTYSLIASAGGTPPPPPHILVLN